MNMQEFRAARRQTTDQVEARYRDHPELARQKAHMSPAVKCLLVLAGLVMAIGLIFAVAGCGSSSGQAEHLPQPTTVRQVAGQLKATGLAMCGSAPGGGVTDSGTAYLGRERIGIDTFPGSSQRDSWKKTAAGFGVAPFEQGPDWVAYKATDQTAKGCQ